jgi:dTDP-4-amino-4,6-dideoxygalactose transaminase
VRTADKLALQGGEPTVPRHLRAVRWPVVTSEDEAAVLAALRGGHLTLASSMGEGDVPAFEAEWAEYVGVRHCVAVSNGTVAIALALAAAGVGPGDEVILPALSFVATATGALHNMAIPVFVDIDAATFNIDHRLIAERITPRTRAIVPVHMHGLPADMDEIRAVAERHGLAVVEDAAQSHGARYRGRRTGSLSAAGAFSLNSSKNLPSCGEAGMVVSDDEELAARVRRSRQFGETVDGERDYLHQELGWNYKPSAVLIAFARSQLRRYEREQAWREANVDAFLAAISPLPGVRVPAVPPDRTHAWHLVRIRFDPAAAGVDGVSGQGFRRALQRALNAEGVLVRPYQRIPLPAQPLFQHHRGMGAGYPWRLGAGDYRYDPAEFPVTSAVLEDSLTIQKAHLDPARGELLELYATAFHKVFDNLDLIARLARSRA